MPADTRYRPPTAVATKEISWQALVVRADPAFERDKHYAEEYASWNDGSRGRTFYADPYRRGAYTPD